MLFEQEVYGSSFFFVKHQNKRLMVERAVSFSFFSVFLFKLKALLAVKCLFTERLYQLTCIKCSL